MGNANFKAREEIEKHDPLVIHSDKIFKLRDSENTEQEDFGEVFLDRHAKMLSELRRQVQMTYEDEKGDITERVVEVYFSGHNKFHGYCHLAQEDRTFRRDRVKQWKMLDSVFIWDPLRAERLKCRTKSGYWTKR